MILTREKLPPLKLRELILHLKGVLSKVIPREKLDVEAMSLEELFDPNNLVSLGVLVEGYFLCHDKNLAGLINGKAYAIFRFTLEGLQERRGCAFSTH
jgi:hypothetical protein